jgi:hypothetical protein
MVELNSESLAHLVSVGGWLRGTEVVATLVSSDYSRDGAELLRQPGLLEYFQRTLAGMKSRLRDHALTVKVRKGLGDIRPLTGGDDARVSQKSAKEIAAIAGDLVKAISSKP